MGRAALSPEEHAAFRREIRAVATRRFARHGHAGVTMRALADDLGVSPMTPYRYFRDKDEILDEVRLAAIEAFVEMVERAYAAVGPPLPRLRALGRAYVEYALEHPDQYMVMFQQPARPNREAAKLDRRGWLPMRDTVGEAVAAGELAGDPDVIAHVFWLAVHGLVTLHLASKLRLGRDLASLVEPTIDHLIAGARPPATKPRRRSR